MIVPDVSLLLYAYDTSAKQHAPSFEWLARALERAEQIGIAMSTIVAFYRLSTDHRIFSSPLTLEQAAGAIETLLAYDGVGVIYPTDRHLPIFNRLVLASRATRDLIPDAHLAALALEHGGIVHTNDHDFDRFEGVRVEYPLIGPSP